MTTPGYSIGKPRVPPVMKDTPTHLRTLSETLNRTIGGRLDSQTTITLMAGANSTILSDARISIASNVILVPATASAAAAVPSVWIVPTNGQALINHANASAADQTFTVSILG